MNSKQLKELERNPLVRQRLAKAMARECFRNTVLEDFHAGTFPSSVTGDYSDVKVVSPYGEITWTKLSRLNDDEMKTLMIDVVNHCNSFLFALFVADKKGVIIDTLKERDPVPKWLDPDPSSEL
jgi:hypothetical protein